ncbi:hypothetical protein GC176_16880 [bacterium]|nr:hypothetical protein [bacterium]
MSEHEHPPRDASPSRLVRLVMLAFRWYVIVPLILILLTVGVICGSRAYRLSLLPPPSLPPEVEALLQKPPVPDEQNAHVDLQRAAARLSKFHGDWDEYDDALKIGWHRASPKIRQHLSNNEEALKLFLAGTSKSDYLQFPINSLDFVNSLPDVSLTREVARLTQLDIARRISQADYSGAAGELRQLLQFAVLISRNGPEISHNVGTAFQSLALQQFVKLIRDEHCPKSVIAELKPALTDVRSGIPPASQCLAVDYLAWAQTSVELRAGYLSATTWKGHDLTQVELFLLAEPEFSTRVYLHHLAMLIPDADVPRRFRTPEMNDPFLRRSANTKEGVTGADLRRADWLSGGPRRFDMQSFLGMYDRRLAFLDLAIITAALRQFRDDHGRFPPRLQELCPQYLDEVPINPLSPTGDGFSYQVTETGCVVYSTGANGIDQSYLIRPQSMWAHRQPRDGVDDFGIRFGSIDCDTADDF